MFADDGVPFRAKMIEYIEREFSDMLPPHRHLLHSDGGLEELARRISRQPTETRSAKAA